MLDLEAKRSEKISPAQLGNIVTEYEQTDLDEFGQPPERSVEIAKSSSVSVCSDLQRAISSVKVLGLDEINQVDPIYRESALPYTEWRFPKLSLFSWAIVFRLAWFLGFSKNGESIGSARSRAKLAAKALEQTARGNKVVIHVGHGIMNRLISRELKKRDWRLVERTGEHYWSYTIFEHD